MKRVRYSRLAVPLRPASSGPVRYWQDQVRLAFKGAIAAVGAWALARYAVGQPDPYFAPLAALLGVYPTVARSLREGVRYVAGFLLGAGLAIPVGMLLGPGIAGIAVVVIAGVLATAADPPEPSPAANDPSAGGLPAMCVPACQQGSATHVDVRGKWVTQFSSDRTRRTSCDSEALRIGAASARTRCAAVPELAGTLAGCGAKPQRKRRATCRDAQTVLPLARTQLQQAGTRSHLVSSGPGVVGASWPAAASRLRNGPTRCPSWAGCRNRLSWLTVYRTRRPVRVRVR